MRRFKPYYENVFQPASDDDVVDRKIQYYMDNSGSFKDWDIRTHYTIDDENILDFFQLNYI